MAVAAAGEMIGDKLPLTPPRGDPPPLAGRVISGALAGRFVAGARGAGVGAATAAAGTYASERARVLLGEHTAIPDPVLGLLEDALVVGVAALIARSSAESPDRPPDEEGPALDGAEPVLDGGRPVHDGGEPSSQPEHARADPSPPSALGALAAGLLAGAAGTTAMSAVQVAYLRATGGEPSSAPGDVGRRLLKAAAGRDVPRERREAFNQAMHVLYGTTWGAPFGLLHRSPPSLLRGLAFGAAVWAVSLIELPLLGIAPPPWRQPVGSLAPDLAFHLVYGTTTAAVYGALTA